MILNKCKDSLYVEPQKLYLYLKYFYLFGSVLIFTRSINTLASHTLQTADYSWPLFLLSRLNLQNQLIVLLSFIVGLLILGVSIGYNPRSRLLRLTASLLFFLLVSFENSFGKFINSCIGWAIIPFVLSFCKFDDSPYWKTLNAKLIWSACSIFISFYLLAGINKAIDFYFVWQSGEGARTIAENYFPLLISENALEWDRLWSLPNIITHPGWFTLLLFVLGIGFELFSFVAIIWPRFLRVAGIFICIFHSLNLILINISFQPSVFLALLLLFLHPLEFERKITV